MCRAWKGNTFLFEFLIRKFPSINRCIPDQAIRYHRSLLRNVSSVCYPVVTFGVTLLSWLSINSRVTFRFFSMACRSDIWGEEDHVLNGVQYPPPPPPPIWRVGNGVTFADTHQYRLQDGFTELSCLGLLHNTQSISFGCYGWGIFEKNLKNINFCALNFWIGLAFSQRMVEE